jgi:hypothetical protein
MLDDGDAVLTDNLEGMCMVLLAFCGESTPRWSHGADEIQILGSCFWKKEHVRPGGYIHQLMKAVHRVQTKSHVNTRFVFKKEVFSVPFPILETIYCSINN